MNFNPNMLPKIRSKALMQSHRNYECALNLASIAGLRCAPQETVVGCHVGNLGKAQGTKTSDLFVASGCHVCHSLLDRVRPEWEIIYHRYPSASLEQITRAVFVTQSLWVRDGLLVVPDGEIL